MNKAALTVLASRFGVAGIEVSSTIRDLPVWTRFDRFDVRTGSHPAFIDYDCTSVGDELYFCAFTTFPVMTTMPWPRFTVRGADGRWGLWTLVGEGAFGGPPVGGARIEAVGGLLNVCLWDAPSGEVSHFVRRGPGSWSMTGKLGNTIVAGGPGAVVEADCATVSGELHFCFTTDDGRLWHTVRQGARWTEFQDVELTPAGAFPGTVVELSAAGVGDELHLCVLTDDPSNNLWHTVRRLAQPAPAWFPFESVQDRTRLGLPVDRVGAAGVDGVLHVCATTAAFAFDEFHLWHVTRSATGSWGRFADLEGLAGPLASPSSRFGPVRLSSLPVPAWQHIGPADKVVAMAASERRLFAATSDNQLWMCDPVPQAVQWRHVGHANNVVAMAAADGKLFAATSDGQLWTRDPVPQNVNWDAIGSVPATFTTMTGASGGLLLAATSDGRFWRHAAGPSTAGWKELTGQDLGGGVVGLATIDGNTFAATGDNRLWLHDTTGFSWQCVAAAPNVAALAAIHGFLFSATKDNRLWMRDSFFGLSHESPLVDVYLGVGAGMGTIPVLDAHAPLPYEFPLADLGPLEPGVTKVLTVRCVNVGGGELELTGSGLALSGDFHDTPPHQNSQLVISPDRAGPGDAAVAVLAFTPTRYGLHAGSLTLRTNSPDVPEFSISLRAAVAGLRLELTPAGPRESVLEFGRVAVGRSASMPLTVHNVGTVDAYLSNLILNQEVPGGQFQVPVLNPGPVVAVGESLTLDFWYNPTVIGYAEAMAYLVVTGTNVPAQTYPTILTGTGLAPAVTLEPTNLTFPDQVVRTVSPAQPVTLRNTGSAPLLVHRVSTTGDYVQTNAWPPSLAAGDQHVFEVHFRPSGGNLRPGWLVVEDNAPGSPHGVALLGSGRLEPIIRLDPPSLDFGDQPLGTGGAGKSLVVTNDGGADLHIGGVAVTGPHHDDFTIAADTCGPAAAIAAEQTCTVTVRFTPSALGTRGATLELTDDAGGSPHRVTLTGVGAVPPALAINPTVLTFPAQTAGTRGAEHTVTLTNSGATPITIDDVKVTGQHAADFALAGSPLLGILAPGQSRNVGLIFAPTEAGARNAILAITDTAPGSPHTMPLAGEATGPAVRLSPPGLVFVDQPVGSFSQPQDVTLTNPGTEPLSISSVTATGDFRHSAHCGVGVTPGGFCLITVICSPTSGGPCIGELTIVDNAIGSPHRIQLVGKGTAPHPTIRPTALDFGDQRVSSTSASKVITLTNDGSAPLTVSGVTVTGSDAGDFAMVANSCLGRGIQPGDTCSLEVGFSPTASGQRVGQLNVTHNGPGSPTTVPMNGTGS
jgi:hypothetical protein